MFPRYFLLKSEIFVTKTAFNRLINRQPGFCNNRNMVIVGICLENSTIYMLKLYMVRLRRRAYKFPRNFVFFRKLLPFCIGPVFQTWLISLLRTCDIYRKGQKNEEGNSIESCYIVNCNYTSTSGNSFGSGRLCDYPAGNQQQ